MTTVGTGDLTFEPVPNWAGDAPITEAVGVAVDSRDRVYIFNRADDAEAPQVIVLDTNSNVLNTWGYGVVGRPHGIWRRRTTRFTSPMTSDMPCGSSPPRAS